MSAPASRPVHPCVLSLTDGSRGCEFSCWAHLLLPADASTTQLPNLVTASASTISVYRVTDSPINNATANNEKLQESASAAASEMIGKLELIHCFSNLAGSVNYLATLPSGRPYDVAPDALLVGFAGQASYSVVTLRTHPSYLLQAECLLDFTSVLQAQRGTTTSTDQVVPDAVTTVLQSRPGVATMATILGGGMAVGVVQIVQQKVVATTTITSSSKATTWMAKSEPYILPLASSVLAGQLPHLKHHPSSLSGLGGTLQPSSSTFLPSATTTSSMMSTGFGDILDATFLTCYVEPVLLLLHTSPQGRVFEGRLGRDSAVGGVSHPYYVTAISISVPHRQSALLWSQAVGTDARQLQVFGGSTTTGGSQLCLVVGVNTLIVLDPTGAVDQVTAVNGWARSTCPTSLLPHLQANPLLKLSIALDGSAWTWMGPESALVSLRAGQLFIFQRMGQTTWSLLPIGQTLGGIGQIEHLNAYPLAQRPWMNKLCGDKLINMSFGLMLAGSRLGNSLLLGYSLEDIVLPRDAQMLKEEIMPIVSHSETMGSMAVETVKSYALEFVMDEDYDRILRLEEDALYAPVGVEPALDGPDLIPDSDMSDDRDLMSSRGRKRQRLAMFSVVRVLTPLDSLINLGPLGPSCEGPVARPQDFLIPEKTSVGAVESKEVFSSPAVILPIGFGSSGGVGVVTAPGQDDRMILDEKDCSNVDCIFSLPSCGLLLVGMSQKAGGGTRVLRSSDTSTGECSMDEVDIREWNHPSDGGRFFETAADVFFSTLHMAGDFLSGSSCVLVSTPSADGSPTYFVAILEEADGALVLKTEIMLDSAGETMCQATPFVLHRVDDRDALMFGCTWSSGRAETFFVGKAGLLSTHHFEIRATDAMDVMNLDEDDEDEADKDIRAFYSDERILCIDIFTCLKSVFVRDTSVESMAPSATSNDGLLIPSYSSDDDDEDAELYAQSGRTQLGMKTQNADARPDIDGVSDETALFIAVCRQSGQLEVFSYEEGGSPVLCWKSVGCGQGVETLQDDATKARLPRSHKVSAKEMRFFNCATTSQEVTKTMLSTGLCLAIETLAGDFELYAADRTSCHIKCQSKTAFRKVRLASIVRSSQEQNRHRMKLIRKRIVDKSSDESMFAYTHLHRFTNISGLDGLFAACTQPAWIVPERSSPQLLVHRTRHGAPAGGKPRPVSSFCSGFWNEKSGSGGFVTLHERIGRVGSQRLTVFHGLSPSCHSQGLLTGHNGYFVEKVPLGVTVRALSFLDDNDVSSQDHPMYAMLVSRETEVDQSPLNNDGLSPKERQAIEEAKLADKVKKQVEADLSGFDIDSEWVEEIEREDCFKVDEGLGGASPIQKQAFSLWIVDASNKWMVVDSFELDEYEHGITMKVLRLTDFPDGTGSGEGDIDEPLNHRLFVAVGTGTVNHNGEDVASKGRLLLFEVTRLEGTAGVAELSLKYEKGIYHGPVNALSCLTSEGRHRLVIGAGADINVEQWGNDRLTQVGFFRGTMHLLDILHFKNFLLLSDAYDSIYFLIWRESDKSLTLLAKDYDPISVYATGLMSRGPAVTFLCLDDRQNLQFFQYAPGEAAARGGNKLVCRADFHLGTQTTHFASHLCRSSLYVHSATPSSTLTALKQQDTFFGKSDDEQKIGALFGTTDGGIFAVIPLSEPIYWRFVALQSVLTNAIESDCALSERAWRLYRRSSRRGGCRSNGRKKGVIDGKLVSQYIDLPLVEQEELASAIGSTVDLILDNLLELQCNAKLI